MPQLVDEFEQKMMEVYRAAKRECGYNATYYLNMLHELGGLQTAKRLLSTEGVQYGFEKLWECGRLDLTVECLVLKPKYHSLFEEAELDQARKRLKALKYDPANCER